ncbi:MAG: undecaprenyldiphospho-muramoylpentapeptide beta-N-acetylglucosaminyltransferase [Syntrophomonadaceae bacterium]|nr:undecaprenyldiphospho-muramoylpentapeptide beta-N-acetylglucosaminyltransferase [Syntrophomonadaceae bacterium]
MKIIITGGGTGGHIYPAIAIAQEIRDRLPEAQILYVGTKEGMESTIVPQAGFDFQTIDITGINRSSLIKASKSLAKMPRSFFQGWEVVRDYRPDIVIGTGGYVSFPVVLAASFLDGKTYIHEQNALPGLANRNLARRVDCVMLTFPEAQKHINAKLIKLTGLPVRKDILNVDVGRARQKLGLTEDKFTLLVFGGSRGAMSINRAMVGAMDRLQHEDIQIIWLTGENGYEETKNSLAERVDLHDMKCNLQILPYMYNMNEALAVSNLAVCRAGASTLCELAVMGLPAILVPYPYAAENHQEMNARALLQKMAVTMVIDEFLDGDTLYQRVSELISDPQRLKQMSNNMRQQARPHALKDIVDIILPQTKK